MRDIIAVHGATKCISVIISSTADIKSYYPARAVRESKITDLTENNQENKL